MIGLLLAERKGATNPGNKVNEDLVDSSPERIALLTAEAKLKKPVPYHDEVKIVDETSPSTRDQGGDTKAGGKTGSVTVRPEWGYMVGAGFDEAGGYAGGPPHVSVVQMAEEGGANSKKTCRLGGLGILGLGPGRTGSA
ncbi:unnamed protein product [Linum trigynum]|uniref:Uncharacterized protein n=1 Tax=Linum trigynum TaxID=586398 RepID=A0AAV2EUL4_9ROSI